MRPGDSRPKISRELLARMTKSAEPVCKDNVCLGAGARSLVSNYRIEKSGGRKNIGDYSKSKLGVRSAYRPGVGSSQVAASPKQPSGSLKRTSSDIPTPRQPATPSSSVQRYNPYA